MTDQMKLIAEIVSNWFEKEFSEGRLSFKSKDWGKDKKFAKTLIEKYSLPFSKRK